MSSTTPPGESYATVSEPIDTDDKPMSFAEALAAQPPLPEAVPGLSNARILAIALEEGTQATHVYAPGFEFDHEQLFAFVKRIVDAVTVKTWGKAEWRAAAVRVYVEDGDDEATAIECARALCREQDWDSADGLDDPVHAALEDLRGRGKPLAFRDPKDSVEPWYAHIPELAAIHGEMGSIHETPAKEQTPEQKARLKALRAEGVALHQARLVDNLVRNRVARSKAAPVVPAELMDAETWRELFRLREAVKGPDGFASWQDAAVHERVRRVKAEAALAAPKGKDPAVAAIQFALTLGVEANSFLHSWNTGDWKVLRRDWPEAPSEVFVHFVESSAYTSLPGGDA